MMQCYSAPSHIAQPDFVDYFIGKNGAAPLGRDAYETAENKYRDDLAAWAKSVGQPHPLNGKFLRTPYADSWAEYMLIKLNGKVALVHIDLMDGWRDAQFERLINVTEAKRMVDTRKIGR